ncbi:MAG: sulfotransferase [Elusimicrobia bacterium]|nr:sulfotransferase [Elusimicrobiota bacterium]
MSWRRAQSLIDRVREFRADSRRRMEKRGGRTLRRRASLADVRKVALILSAPRSGSSLLQALLKTLPGTYALNGECVPFHKLNGVASDEDASDAIPAQTAVSAARRSALAEDMLEDLSLPGSTAAARGWEEDYIDALALRLPLQWPQIRFSYREIRQAAGDALAAQRAAAPAFETTGFYLGLLARLRERHPAIDPYYYDIPAGRVAARFPGLRPPEGPPNDTVVIEEPPFILIEPRRRADAAALADKTLLLKSTVNCYRLDFILSLFPRAEVRVVHLTRNPLASINGLCDGWLHRGFFSHNLRAFSASSGRLRRGLSIAGYSDARPWTRWWWNFDLPPGWEALASSRLESVCAFQWMSAQRTIREALARTHLPSLRLKFEDIAGSLESRREALRGLCRFLVLAQDSLDTRLIKDLPVVQATQPPDPARWHRRQDALLPLMRDPQLREAATSAGYDD